MVAPVIDPGLPAHEQRRLVRRLNAAERMNGSPSGAEDYEVFSWRAAFNLKPKKAASGDLSRCVLPSDLDASSHALLGQAQHAIRVISSSAVHGRYISDPSAGEKALRMHEWDIAVALKKISELSFANERLARGAPGPMTATVLASQRQALEIAKRATTARIGALEHYAAELKLADAAEHDWQTAVEASSSNGQYLDLVARTAADEHAISEIQGLTEQVSAARDAFHEHLRQATLAAEALVFPVTPP